MFWIYFLAIAVLTAVSEKILHRINLTKFSDTGIYTFTYQMSAAIFLLILSSAQLDTAAVLNASPTAMGLLILQALFWSSFAYFSFRADRLLPASQSAIISRLRMVWALPIGWIIFHEDITSARVIGVILILASVIFLNYSGLSQTSSRRGNQFAILASISIAISLTVDKMLTRDFSPEIVAIFSFLFSAIFMALATKNLRPRLKSFYQAGGFRCLLAAVVGAISHVSLLKALTSGPFSIIIPTYQAGTILTVLAGIYLLKENENKTRKIAAVAISYIGIIIISFT